MRVQLARRDHMAPVAVCAREELPLPLFELRVSCPMLQVRPLGTVNVIVMMRLVWRKGTHLLVEIIPEICRRFPYVHFIIGGDGPNRGALEEMRERDQLQERVELLGAVPHCDVPSVLTRGHILLNTSLTEAFCIAILEAVACGLLVVSTKVGGVPEILPRHMLHFAEPNGDALLKCLSGAISGVRHDKNARPATSTFHRNVSAMYSWRHVARRTARVYSDAVAWSTRTSLSERLHQLCALGAFAGPAAILVTVVQHLFLSLLRPRRPACDVERAPESSVAANVQWFRKEPVPRTEVLAKLCTRNSCKPLLVVGGIH